jgi:transposase
MVGRPRRWPPRLYAGRGYDHDKYRRLGRTLGITPLIARRGVEHGTGLGKIRWPAERTLAWLKGFRRLRIRTERRADHPPNHPQPRLLDHLPPQAHSELISKSRDTLALTLCRA